MTRDRNHSAAAVDKADALAVALEQSQDVKAKVEACADELASANDIVKKKIAEGATTLSAHKALANTERAESKVQECADDLHEVTETLAQGIDDLKQTEIALAKARDALADTEAALATAQEEEKKARRRALHDSSTGLPNRDLFDDRLAHAISLARRHDWTLAVMFLDLDRFISINDRYGHAVGDLVLKEVARRLLQHSRDEDTVCRNGGDEFLYLLMNPQGGENIELIAGTVLKDIAQPIDIDDLQLVIKSSVGIAVYPDHGTTGEQLIRNADTAMYRAKKRMSGGCVFFNALETDRPLPEHRGPARHQGR
jgi:diguanylate cyclase (GGDEF)-like protein